MDWTLVFIFAMPLAVVLFIIWMIAGGYTKTGAIPPDTEPNPYPERFDAMGRWMLGGATVILYVVVAIGIHPLAAAILFAILLLIDAAGALIWTVGQEVLARRRSIAPAVPFRTRLFRNFRDFYASIVLNVLAHG